MHIKALYVRHKTALGYGVGVALISYILWSVNFEWSKLFLVSFADIALLSIASIILLLMNAFGVWLQLAIFGFKIPWKEAFHISQFYNLLNYLPLKAGVIGEGVWLKKQYGFPYKKYVASIIFTYVANFFVYAVVILVVFGFFRDPSSIFSLVRPLYISYFLFFVVVALVVYFLTPKFLTIRNNFSALFEDRIEIIKAKRYVATLIVVLLVSLFTTAFRFVILFGVLGYSLSWPAALLMSVIASFSFLVAFTPGGLGIREGFLGAMSLVLFQNAAAGAIVSMIIRIIEFIWIGILGAFAFHHLNRSKLLKEFTDVNDIQEKTSEPF